MATRYYLNDAAEPAGYTLGLQELRLIEGSVVGSPTTVTGSIPASGSGNVHFTTVSGVPNQVSWIASWPWSLSIASATSLSMNLLGTRISDDTNSSSGSNVFASSLTGTGIKSGTASSVFTSSGNVTDRLNISVQGFNSNMMAAENLTLDVNVADSYVEAPWTVSGGPPPDTSAMLAMF